MNRTLVICGDRWHPAETVRAGLAPLSTHGFHFAFADEIAASSLSASPLVVLARSNIPVRDDQKPWLNAEIAIALRDHLRRGGGFLAVHAGTARYDRSPVMNALLGGAFVRHPESCPVTYESIASHPVTDTILPFTVEDEHYFVAMNDPGANIFLQSRSGYGRQPAGWTRTEGAGRVCALTPGHYPELWAHPMFQKLLLNALRWTAASLK